MGESEGRVKYASLRMGAHLISGSFMEIMSASEVSERRIQACKSLINFELPESAPWWDISPGKITKDLSDMINDIVDYQELWMVKKSLIPPEALKAVLRQMDLWFIQVINTEEGVGTLRKSDTMEILQTIWKDEDGKCACSTRTSLSTPQMETTNLYKALTRIRELDTIGRVEDERNLGLLEMESFVKGVHTILMTGLIDTRKLTPPGVFSTVQRVTTFKGMVHYYPTRSLEEWDCEIQTLIDRYNGLIELIKNDYASKSRRHKAVTDLFKCTAWFLFTFTSMHPFSDANGRMSKLLVCYLMYTISPFPSPVYNIYDDSDNDTYLDALVKAREDSGNPAEIAALIIESNWQGWRIFLQRLELCHF